MIAADPTALACGTAAADLLLAAVFGSIVFELIEIYLSYQRGFVDAWGHRHENHWPPGTQLWRLAVAGLFRALVAAAVVGLLTWAMGAICSRTAAGAVGFALWPAITTFLGYVASVEHDERML